MSYTIAKEFWTKNSRYPNYPNTKQRRFIDISFVMQHLGECKSVMDIGCADGYLLLVLREITDIERFYAYDINSTLLEKLQSRWDIDSILHAHTYDLSKKEDFPTTDLTLCMGLFPYIFKEDDINTILSNIKSDTLIVRAPCTMKDKDEYINKFSDDLGCDYSSIYRTKDNYLGILGKFYNDIKMIKSYPDEIESKYGTKHYYFVCT